MAQQRETSDTADPARGDLATATARFDLKLVSAERDHRRLSIGVDVNRNGEHFQYFECWTSRTGTVPFGDRQQLVAAATRTVSDRLASHIQPLADPNQAIILPIEPHPHGVAVGQAITAAILNLAVIHTGSLEAATIHTVDLPDPAVALRRPARSR